MDLIKYITSKEYRANERSVKKIEEAKKEADRMKGLTGYKYYVINWADGYKVVNMQWINRMKKAGLLPKTYDWLRLEKYSVYITG